MSVTMQCPKCDGQMRSVERNGVMVDRCTQCGGIFLDRGELERLMRAETEYIGERYRDRDDDRDDWDERDREHPGRRKKRRGFLEDIFDFG